MECDCPTFWECFFEDSGNDVWANAHDFYTHSTTWILKPEDFFQYNQQMFMNMKAQTPIDIHTYRPQHPDPDAVKRAEEKSYEMGGMSASQIGGEHYKQCAIQPWDFVIANELDYFQGSIVKYITRWKNKGGIEDLKKARHFLDKYIEFSMTMNSQNTSKE